MSLQAALAQLQAVTATAVGAKMTYQYIPVNIVPSAPFVLAQWQNTVPDSRAYGAPISNSKSRTHSVLLVVGVGVNRASPWADKDAQTYSAAVITALQTYNTLNGTCTSVKCESLAPVEVTINDGNWSTVQGVVKILEYI